MGRFVLARATHISVFQVRQTSNTGGAIMCRLFSQMEGMEMRIRPALLAGAALFGLLGCAQTEENQCVKGRDTAAELLREFFDSKDQMALLPDIESGQLTINLENIITDSQDQFKTICEADVIANSHTRRFAGHIHYTVSFTAEGKLYVQALPTEFLQTRHGAVAIRVGIEFGAISSVTRLPDYAARSRI
jgi:hypothetical protein